MRHLIGLILVLIFGSAHAVTIDFEEYLEGEVNKPSGDSMSKGFTLDYTGGWAIVSALSSPNGTKGFLNCGACAPVITIDIFDTTGDIFSLSSMDIGSVVAGSSNYDFLVTGFLPAGGTISQSVLGVTSMQTMSFDSSWSSLSAFRIDIDNTNGNSFSASFVDNIVVTAVPIPAAVWLFGTALAGIVWLRRKQTT